MTAEERILWGRVRRNGTDFHFRRQQVIRGFVADFYCHAAALVVEIDGAVHADQAEYDADRTAAFNELGIVVLRFWNSEVTGNLEGVLERIVETCQVRVTLGQEPNPPAPFPKREGGEEADNTLAPPSLLGKGAGGLGSSAAIGAEEPT